MLSGLGPMSPSALSSGTPRSPTLDAYKTQHADKDKQNYQWCALCCRNCNIRRTALHLSRNAHRTAVAFRMWRASAVDGVLHFQYSFDMQVCMFECRQASTCALLTAAFTNSDVVLFS